MSRFLLSALCIWASCALSAPSSTTTDADLAYSIGASVGERLHQEAPNLPLEALLEGLRQAYSGQSLRLDATRRQVLLEQHDAQAQAAARIAADEQARLAEQRFLAAERARNGVKALDAEVLYEVLVQGNGASPGPQSQVEVRYVGRLPDGTVFDQTLQPQWFHLDSVIAGWQVALQRMKVGARWRVVIPSQQAYGAEGAGDLIAPYTPLVFDIELIAVKG